MNASSLPAAIRAAAEGICTLEAAAGLVLAHGTWLGRDDFARFIHHGADTAAIDWEAAISALDAGGLPCSAGEKRMLRLAASLAGQATISLGEAVTGIDDRNCDLLIKSVWHAAGRRQFSWPTPDPRPGIKDEPDTARRRNPRQLNERSHQYQTPYPPAAV